MIHLEIAKNHVSFCGICTCTHPDLILVEDPGKVTCDKCLKNLEKFKMEFPWLAWPS